MTDPMPPAEEVRCAWCASTAGPDEAGRCRSCGANITGSDLSEPVPGVTDVDTLGIMKQRTAREPNRIVSWVTGDAPSGESWAPAGEALEAPSPDVQREMLRMELDAAIAARQAEIDAMKADEALEALGDAGRAAAQNDPSEPVEGPVEGPVVAKPEESTGA
jgi:hypothetical protein